MNMTHTLAKLEKTMTMHCCSLRLDQRAGLVVRCEDTRAEMSFRCIMTMLMRAFESLNHQRWICNRSIFLQKEEDEQTNERTGQRERESERERVIERERRAQRRRKNGS